MTDINSINDLVELSKNTNANKEKKNEAEQRIELFRAVFSTDDGAKALREIAKKTGVFNVTPISSTNAEAVFAYERGMRDMYLWIRKHLTNEILNKVERHG